MLAASLAVLGCGDATADAGTGAGSTTGSATSTGTSDGEPTTGPPPDPPEDGPQPCRADRYPVRAPLCGGSGGLPCVVKRDELFSSGAMSHYDRPSLALRGSCEPSLVFGSSMGPTGFFAQRWPDGAWQVETTPNPLLLADLAIDEPTGDAIVGAYVDPFMVSLWRRSAGQWANISDLPGENFLHPGQLALDQAGGIHIVHTDSSSAAYYRKYDGNWHEHLLIPKAGHISRIGLTSTDAPQVALWNRSGEKPVRLLWSAPPAPPEAAVALNWNSIARPDFAMGVAPDDTPWLLLNGDYDDDGDYTLLLAHRDPAGTWTSEVLITEEVFVDTCPPIPSGPGETCESEGTMILPRAVLASADEVRAIYYWRYYKTSSVAECDEYDECLWTHGEPPVRDDELRLAWPGSPPSEHITLVEDVETPLSAQLDTSGNIHIAFFQWFKPPAEWLVRYLVVGP